MGYVIVEFPECREVFIGDDSQGNNLDENGECRILRVGDGRQTFRLGGAQDCKPPARTVIVKDTTSINPLRVVFEKKAPDRTPNAPGAPDESSRKNDFTQW